MACRARGQSADCCYLAAPDAVRVRLLLHAAWHIVTSSHTSQARRLRDELHDVCRDDLRIDHSAWREDAFGQAHVAINVGRVGLGAAADVAMRELPNDMAHVERLSERLMSGIREHVPEVVLNGHATQRHAGNVNLSFAYVEGESLLMSLKNIAVSSGSACTSASLEPSYVLRAIGVSEDLAHTSLRFGLGRFTTEAEVDFAIDLLRVHVARLREMSPLWELVQEGVDLSTINWTQDAAHHHH